MEKKCEKAEDILSELKSTVHRFNDKLSVLSGGCLFIQRTENLTSKQKRMLELVVQACKEFSEESAYFVNKATQCLNQSEKKERPLRYILKKDTINGGNMSKGSDYRPHNKKKFNENFDRIFGEKSITEIHRDKTCGLKISWPEVDRKKPLFNTRDSKITGKRYIACTFCGAEYVPGEGEPCEHIKALKEQCEDWLN